MELAAMRKQAGFSTQEQLSKHSNIPRSTIAKWEAGITRPTLSNAIRLAKALNCTIDELLNNEEQAG